MQEFHKRVIKNNKFHIISIENHLNHENQGIPYEKYNNYENHRNSNDNQKTMKIIAFHVRIMKI